MHRSRSPATDMILDAPVGSVLWRLATPNVMAVAMMTAVTFADAWYVGQLGTAALASLALAFPFLTLMRMMAGGSIGGGTTSADIWRAIVPCHGRAHDRRMTSLTGTAGRGRPAEAR